jgi:hypothetical protein
MCIKLASRYKVACNYLLSHCPIPGGISVKRYGIALEPTQLQNLKKIYISNFLSYKSHLLYLGFHYSRFIA